MWKQTGFCLFFIGYVSSLPSEPTASASQQSRYFEEDVWSFVENQHNRPHWPDFDDKPQRPREPFGLNVLPISRQPGYHNVPVFQDENFSGFVPIVPGKRPTNNVRQQKARNYVVQNSALYRHQVEHPSYNPGVYYRNLQSNTRVKSSYSKTPTYSLDEYKFHPGK